MKKFFRGKKKFIFGAVALALIASVIAVDLAGNVSEAQASQTVFMNVKNNYQTQGLSVLEITPSANYAEMGYFVEKNSRQGNIGEVSYGSKYLPYGDSDKQAIVMRRYGMIKWLGMDSHVNGVGEYPIYVPDRAMFSYAADPSFYRPIDSATGEYVLGTYSMNTQGTGNYRLKDGYVLGTGTENFASGTAFNSEGQEIVNLDKDYFYEAVVTDDTVSENGTVTATGYTTYTKITYTSGIPSAVEYIGTGNGNVDFTYILNGTGNYQGYSKEVYWMLMPSNRYFYNGKWFKEYVLGSGSQAGNISYTNKNANDVTAADIAAADLVYISGTAADYRNAGMDLSPDAVREIFNKSAVDHKAVMMDYAVYSGDAVSNIDKLALMLWQENQLALPKASGTSYENYFDLDGYINAADAANVLNNTELFATLKNSIQTGYNGSFAMNNVYVYNHHWQDFQDSRLKNEQVDALDNFANGDLASPYTGAVVAGGFQSVAAYIKLNNKDVTTGAMTEGYITPAIAIQYILSYRGEDLELSKNEYHILEVQPTKEFRFNTTTASVDYSLATAEVKANRDEFITLAISEDIVVSGKQDLVSFTSMTIDEFNTVQEDLLSNYDLVYIGDEHRLYYDHGEMSSKSVNSATGSISFNSVSVPKFNDAGMNGMVYYSYGDQPSGEGGNKNTVRYSSRDLTDAKLNCMKDYLERGGLVIVAEDLMKSAPKGNKMINPTGLSESNEARYDHGRVDTSSNMYELLQFALGNGYDAGSASYSAVAGGLSAEAAIDRSLISGNALGTEAAGGYSNLISEADIASGMISQVELAAYLNRERISLTMISEPTEYSYITDNMGAMSSITYLEPDKNDGKYYLKYQFSINNTAIATAGTDLYLVHFYQDVNADGRFGESEELFDYEVTIAANDSKAPNTTTDGVTQYNLNNGVLYELSREVPSDEGGIINWCVKVEKMSNQGVNCQETGYTAIKPRQKKYMNILQIIPDENATLDLENLGDQTPLGKFIYSPAIMDQYEINVRTVTVGQFQADTIHFMGVGDYASLEARWQDYFNNFERTESDGAYTADQIAADEDKPMAVSMLVFGFGDTYTQFNNAIPINAIKTFIESGKPVLTSNNFIRQDIGNSSNANIGLLSYFGQDRYGYTNALYDSIENRNVFYTVSEQPYQEYVVSRENAGNAVAYLPGSARGLAHLIPNGYTNYFRINSRANGGYGFINTDVVKAHSALNDTTTLEHFTYLDQMNEGQIAHYPYTVGDKVLVHKSHAQYYQLDLDTDTDRDGKSDIVVWYTLGEMVGASDVPASSSYPDNSVTSGNLYSATPGDGINNYYIYNNGNITFTGLGASNTMTNLEAQLFVNTLVAAYEAGLVNPVVTYYQTADPDDGTLESIAVPYDANVTARNEIDSSIQYNERGTDFLYKFVNPNTDAQMAQYGTKAFFKITDSNYVKGEKVADVAFYMGVSGNAGDVYTWKDGNRSFSARIQEIQLSDNTVVTVVRIPIDIYNFDFSKKIGRTSSTDTSPQLEVGTMYGLYAPMSYLETMGSAKIYIQANTGYKTLNNSGQEVVKPLGTAYDMFTEIKQDLLKLD